MIGRHVCRLALAWGVALTGLLILSTAQGGFAATAQEQLKGAIDRVVSTLASASDRKSTRLNSSHIKKSRMPSSA